MILIRSLVGLLLVAVVWSSSNFVRADTPAADVASVTTMPIATSTLPVGAHPSVHEIRYRLESHGFVCDEWRVVIPSVMARATEQAFCTERVVIRIHLDEAQVERSVDLVKSVLAIRTPSFLLGPNWTVSCPRQLCVDFQAFLGGEID